jgi:glycosyltransferase involved in cell wall biosynthesis
MDINIMKLSLITCTYNPNTIIFNRLIEAIALLETDGLDVEWIVVDNNSTKPVEEQFDFTRLSIPVVHVIEKKPGLTSARVAGISAAKGNWAIFFDDDNEPFSDYLIQVNERIDASPKLMCFGPGKINVEFIGDVHSKWVQSKKEYFQEKDEPFTETNSLGWSNGFPQGTGQVVHKKILAEYVTQVKEGNFSVQDRTGKSLSSGGDVQIVLFTILKGYFAGVDPALQLNHLIEGRKATFKYIRRLVYGTASSYISAYNQVCIEKQLPLNYSSNTKLLKKIYHHFTFFKFSAFKRSAIVRFCNDMGQIKAPYNANKNKPEPFVLQIIDYILS